MVSTRPPTQFPQLSGPTLLPLSSVSAEAIIYFLLSPLPVTSDRSSLYFFLGVEQSEAKFTDHLASGCGVRAGEVTAFPIPVSPKCAVVDMNSQQCCATFVHLRCSSVRIFH